MMLRNIQAVAVIGVCCTPAALINLKHAAETGGGEVLFSVIAVCFVIAAAISGVVFDRSRGINRIVAAGLLIGFTTANFANAISVNGSHRAAERDSAAHEQAGRKSLNDDAETLKKTIGDLEARLGTLTVSSLTAEIEAMKLTDIYLRTRSCLPAEVTLPESREHCRKLAEREAQLLDAERLAAMREKLANVRHELRRVKAPENADRSAAAITATLSLIGIVTSERFAGTVLDLLRAALIEALAAFMPMILLAGRHRQKTVEPIVAVSKTPKEQSTCSVRAFVSTLNASGDFRPASEFYFAYQRYCRARKLGDPKTPRALGLGLRNAGFEKKLVGGKSHWRARIEESPRLAVAS